MSNDNDIKLDERKFEEETGLEFTYETIKSNNIFQSDFALKESLTNAYLAFIILMAIFFAIIVIFFVLKKYVLKSGTTNSPMKEIMFNIIVLFCYLLFVVYVCLQIVTGKQKLIRQRLSDAVRDAKPDNGLTTCDDGSKTCGKQELSLWYAINQNEEIRKRILFLISKFYDVYDAKANATSTLQEIKNILAWFTPVNNKIFYFKERTLYSQSAMVRLVLFVLVGIVPFLYFTIMKVSGTKEKILMIGMILIISTLIYIWPQLLRIKAKTQYHKGLASLYDYLSINKTWDVEVAKKRIDMLIFYMPYANIIRSENAYKVIQYIALFMIITGCGLFFWFIYYVVMKRYPTEKLMQLSNISFIMTVIVALVSPFVFVAIALFH